MLACVSFVCVPSPAALSTLCSHVRPFCRELQLTSIPPTLIAPVAKTHTATATPQPQTQTSTQSQQGEFDSAQQPSDEEQCAWSPWAPSTRALDLSHNRLTALPSGIRCLTGLTSLRVNHNPIESGGVPWGALAALTGLTLIACNNTQLTSVPEGVMTHWGNLKMMTFANSKLQVCIGVCVCQCVCWCLVTGVVHCQHHATCTTFRCRCVCVCVCVTLSLHRPSRLT